MNSVSTSVGAGVQTAARRTNIIQRYPLPVFFILAFALTWAIQIPQTLDTRGMLPFHVPPILLLVAGFMPAVAAIIVAAIASGRAGVRDLFSRLVRWRVGVRWYALALFGSLAIWLAGLGINSLLGGSTSWMPALSPSLLVNTIVLLAIYLVLNWEDFAWRGFALVRMQARQSTLVASLILGVIEALFHLPLFFSPQATQSSLSFGWFTVFSVGAVVIYSWIFNNAKGSILPVMLWHASQNTWTSVFAPAAGDGTAFTIPTILYAIIAVILVIRFGGARLSDKPENEFITVVDPIQK
jgi:membrane protease YdiL (CAAX protease family)